MSKSFSRSPVSSPIRGNKGSGPYFPPFLASVLASSVVTLTLPVTSTTNLKQLETNLKRPLPHKPRISNNFQPPHSPNLKHPRSSRGQRHACTGPQKGRNKMQIEIESRTCRPGPAGRAVPRRFCQHSITPPLQHSSSIGPCYSSNTLCGPIYSEHELTPRAPTLDPLPPISVNHGKFHLISLNFSEFHPVTSNFTQ